MSYLIGLYALFRGRNINKFISLQGDFSEDDPNKMPTTISTLIDIQDSILLKKSQPKKKKSKDTLRKVKRLLE